MNIKSFLVGTTIGAVVVGGVWLIFGSKETVDTNVAKNIDTQYAQQQEVKNDVKEEKQKDTLTVVSYTMEHLEEFDSDNYVVIVENTSGKTLRKVTFSFGEGTYELYNVLPNEKYRVIAYNTETEINLRVISVEYEFLDYMNNDITVEIDTANLKGKIHNNTQMELYPNLIILNYKDSNGILEQKPINYSGCFFEERVIKANSSFEFEIESYEGYTFVSAKDVVFVYSDLEFNMYNTQILNEM